jgi:PAS domain S-box-containing protein
MARGNQSPSLGHILVVDDEVELMTILCNMLAEQGYETEGFTSGKEALDALEEHDVDLLLTDLMMPEMDGIALLKVSLQIDPNLAVIIMTGQGTVETAVEAIKVGACDYIMKPFKMGMLLPVLSRAMEIRRLRLDNIQLRETVAIYELTRAIAFPFDMNVILNKVADAALQQCSADEVSIMLPTRDKRNELYVAVAHGGHQEHSLGSRISLQEGIAGWVARNREPLVLHGKPDDPRFKPVYPRDEIRHAVSMPMLSGGELVGVLNVNVTSSRRALTLGQVKALTILVSIVAPVLESSWLYTQMRDAEERYRSIFENAMEGIFQSTPDGRHLTVNPAYARMFGYDSPEEITRDVSDIAHQLYVNPEDRLRFKEMLDREGRVDDFETTLRRRDGNLITVRVKARAAKDEKGAVLYYEGTSEDVTERKKAEKRLVESEERYRALVETSPDGIALCDLDLNIIMMNRAGLRLTGCENVDEVRGRNLVGTLPPEHAILAKEKMERMIADGVPFTPMESYHTTGASTRILVELTASVIRDAAGQPALILGIARDITERKKTQAALIESEYRFRSLVETTSDLIWETGKDGRYTYASPKVRDLLGYEPEEVIGKSPFDLMSPDEADRMRRVLKPVTKSRTSFSGLENVNLHRGGWPVSLETSGTPLFDGDGRFLGYMGFDKDITRRKRALAALEHSEARYRSIFENAQEGIFQTAPDGTLAGVNPALSKMAGFSCPGEMMSAVGNIVQLYVDSEDRNRFIDLLRRQGTVNGFETRVRIASGEVRWISVSASKVRDVLDGSIYYEGIVSGITDRKETERQSRLTEIRQKALLDLHEMADVSTDEIIRFVVGKCRTVTESDHSFIGLINEEETVMDTYFWSENIAGECALNLESKPLVLKDAGLWAEAVRQKRAVTVNDYSEPNLQKRGCPEGHVPLERFMTVPVLNDGRVVLVAGVANKKEPYNESDIFHMTMVLKGTWDRMQRKRSEQAIAESEEKYRSIFESVVEGVYRSTSDGKFLSVNPAMASMYGYESPEEMVAAIADVRQTLWVDEPARMQFQERLEKKGLVRNFEHRSRKKDGTIIWVSLSAHVSGTHANLREGVIEDVTARKQAEKMQMQTFADLEDKNREIEKAYGELKRSQKKMLQQEKMASIGQLSAGVAHEINNPIGFITSNLNSLQRYMAKIPEFILAQGETIEELARLDERRAQDALQRVLVLRKSLDIDFIIEDVRELIGESIDGAERVSRIVQDLKGFSRTSDAKYEPADINSGLESTLNIVWNELKYKAEVKKKLGTIPFTKCNIGQLNQVFMNILINAGQAIEKYGEVSIRTWHEEAHIFIAIADTGPGIPEQNLDRIFEPFYTTKPVGQGTGLGLSIAYDIVKKHEGEIEVASIMGAGTTFTIKIPVRED